MDLKQVMTATALAVALAASWTASETRLAGQAPDVQVPIFEDDPTFPTPLPEHWAIGPIGGLAVDRQDHVGENFDARRFQRFLYKGLGRPVAGANPPTTLVR